MGTYMVYVSVDAMGLSVGKTGRVAAIPESGSSYALKYIGKATIIETATSYIYLGIEVPESVGLGETDPVLVEFEVEWDEFEGLPTKVLAKSIGVLDLDEKRFATLAAIRGRDCEYIETYIISMFVEDIRETGVLMKEQMDDSPIESGPHAGKMMLDVMSTISYDEVRSFLEYVLTYSGKYMAQDWKLNEIFSTWLIRGSVAGEKFQGDRTLGHGMSFGLDPSGYPRISGMIEKSYIPSTVEAGDLVIQVNGESAWKMDPDKLLSMMPKEEGGMLDLRLMNDEANIYEYSVLCMQISSGNFQSSVDAGEPFDPTLFSIRENDKWGYMDATGDVIIETDFHDVKRSARTFPFGLIPVRNSEKLWGYCNLEGKMVIDYTYDKADIFEDGVAQVEFESEYGFTTDGGYIDSDGKVVVPIEYYLALFSSGFKEGMTGYMDDYKYGFLNKKGEVAIAPRFNSINSFYEGLARVKLEKDGLWGYIDKKGEFVIQPKYFTAREFYDGQAYVMEKKDGEWQVIDQKGRVLFTPEAALGVFFAKARPVMGRIRALKDGKYGFMDSKGKLVIPAIYTHTNEVFNEGLVAVTQSTEKKEKGWGMVGGYHFIDINGNTVIEGPFEDAGIFTDGYAWVKVDGLWGLIDKQGNFVINPFWDGFRPSSVKNGVSLIEKPVNSSGGYSFDRYHFWFNVEGDILWDKK